MGCLCAACLKVAASLVDRARVAARGTALRGLLIAASGIACMLLAGTVVLNLAVIFLLSEVF